MAYHLCNTVEEPNLVNYIDSNICVICLMIGILSLYYSYFWEYSQSEPLFCANCIHTFGTEQVIQITHTATRLAGKTIRFCLPWAQHADNNNEDGQQHDLKYLHSINKTSISVLRVRKIKFKKKHQF